MTDHQRGTGPLAQQLHKLAVKSINLISKFFQGHAILVCTFASGSSSGDPLRQRIGTKLRLKLSDASAAATAFTGPAPLGKGAGP